MDGDGDHPVAMDDAERAGATEHVLVEAMRKLALLSPIKTPPPAPKKAQRNKKHAAAKVIRATLTREW